MRTTSVTAIEIPLIDSLALKLARLVYRKDHAEARQVARNAS